MLVQIKKFISDFHNKVLKFRRFFLKQIFPIPTRIVVSFIMCETLIFRDYIFLNLDYLAKRTAFLNVYYKQYANLFWLKINSIIAKIDKWKDECDSLSDYYAEQAHKKRLEFYKTLQFSVKHYSILFYNFIKNVISYVYKLIGMAFIYFKNKIKSEPKKIRDNK